MLKYYTSHCYSPRVLRPILPHDQVRNPNNERGLAPDLQVLKAMLDLPLPIW
jgi:hypothetical protein